GWIVLAAAVIAIIGAALRMRPVIGPGVWQVWAFACAAFGGVAAFVNAVHVTAAGDFELADISFGVVVSLVAAVSMLAFTVADGEPEPGTDGARA
ncbi:MAG TPA: hypothetical protein VNL92_05095, partial [Dehalococcoidia bacterium]|nr:hypothetical protein [Dehalococcoidia bacterium]